MMRDMFTLNRITFLISLCVVVLILYVIKIFFPNVYNASEEHLNSVITIFSIIILVCFIGLGVKYKHLDDSHLNNSNNSSSPDSTYIDMKSERIKLEKRISYALAEICEVLTMLYSNKRDEIGEFTFSYLETIADIKELSRNLYYLPVDDLPKLYKWATTIKYNDDTAIDNINDTIKKYLKVVETNKGNSEHQQNTNKSKESNTVEAAAAVEYSNDVFSSRFDHNNEILANEFRNATLMLERQRSRFIFWGTFLTLALGVGYLLFFYLQFQKGNLNYRNHLLLIAVCSPIISLIVWMFWYVSHLTHLIDIYTFKGNLAKTLQTTIEYTLNVCDSENNKDVAAKLLQDLIGNLYDPPIKDTVKKNTAVSLLSETTQLLKEIKGIIKKD